MNFFNAVIAAYVKMGIDVSVEVKGIRPCAMGVYEKRLEQFTMENKALVEAVTGRPCQVVSNSTDANIPLSMGIPANTLGTVRGGLPHTREEWVDLDSIEDGFKIAMGIIMRYFS